MKLEAKIVKLADEEGMPAIIEIKGNRYEVMDCTCYSSIPTEVGKVEEIELVIGLEDETETIDDIFDGNPNKLSKLESLGGWTYKAYGKIISINPVSVDCGVGIIEAIFSTNDQRCIGKYVGFKISRLDVFLKC